MVLCASACASAPAAGPPRPSAAPAASVREGLVLSPHPPACGAAVLVGFDLASAAPVDALVVATAGSLLRLDGVSLTEVWRAPLSARAGEPSSFAVSGDAVLVHDAAGLRSLELSTGAPRASLAEARAGRHVTQTAVPGVALVREDGLFARVEGSTLVDEGGPRVEPKACSVPRARAFCDGPEDAAVIPGFEPRFVLGGGFASVAVADGALVGFEARSRRVLWQRAVTLAAVFREGDEVFALSAAPPRLVSLDARSGREAWSVEEQGADVVARRDRVYVASCGRLAIRARATGELLAELR